MLKNFVILNIIIYYYIIYMKNFLEKIFRLDKDNQDHYISKNLPYSLYPKISKGNKHIYIISSKDYNNVTLDNFSFCKNCKMRYNKVNKLLLMFLSIDYIHDLMKLYRLKKVKLLKDGK